MSDRRKFQPSVAYKRKKRVRPSFALSPRPFPRNIYTLMLVCGYDTLSRLNIRECGGFIDWLIEQ